MEKMTTQISKGRPTEFSLGDKVIWQANFDPLQNPLKTPSKHPQNTLKTPSKPPQNPLDKLFNNRGNQTRFLFEILLEILLDFSDSIHGYSNSTNGLCICLIQKRSDFCGLSREIQFQCAASGLRTMHRVCCPGSRVCTPLSLISQQ
jgi:hypothetical protein